MSSDYKLIYHRYAVKFLAKQEKVVQERIALGIRGLLEVPPIGNIKPMKGYMGLYRLKVGMFRVLFRIDHQVKIVCVEAIGSRGDVYK